MKFIFIDGSYFIFFRLNALKNWWSLAHRDDGELNPAENNEFKDKFRQMFADKLKEIPKKLGIKKGEPYRVFVGQDCRREAIWRNQHIGRYKAGRADTTVEGEFFRIVYQEQLFQRTLGETCLLSHPSLEADDVIALSVKHICKANPDDECFIVSSDGDYLQLCASVSNFHIYDLKFKDVKTRDQSYSQPETAMRMFVAKRLSGDKSDNIPPVFPKCGKKTALTLAEMVGDDGDDGELMTELAKRGGAKAVEQYRQNDLIMNFDKIPHNLQVAFLASTTHRFQHN